ncbi:SDR family oxidoreductase [Bernardetia sp. ABR2-2B]|uniref:SDR family oxidoreductase n=1 Tax=Bernardetia sp. ABR2-2B TaxID=3127472 RepID=UPI0030CB4F3F
MHILLTGSTGYIGRRLLPILVQSGHSVTCLVRDVRRFDLEDFDEEFMQNVQLVEVDLMDVESLDKLPKDIDAAYYFVHGMSTSYGSFTEVEKDMAINFAEYISTTQAKQIIYLSGISNDDELSAHLQSRKLTESYLKKSGVPVTVLRAAIIIGSGSASFEIIRDLVEKLPVMVAPKWIKTKCQPIAIRDVIYYLEAILLKEDSFNRIFDIGGPNILTYKEMMMQYAEVRNLNRSLFTIPLLTPRLSSYWLYFVTSTSYNLARSLVDSMHHDVVCEHKGINEIVPRELLSYKEALEKAFQKIAQSEVVSSWKDTLSGPIEKNFLDFVQVPTYGCLTDKRRYDFARNPREVIDNIWAIGDKRGWYYGTWLWKLRGFLDKLVGGVGLRRGRRDAKKLKAGDALDFWRVLLADRQNGRLLLYAEMKLPGEAWLEFQIKEKEGKNILIQNATFRPLGLWGRLYWYLVLPLHSFVFPGMAKGIISYQEKTV